MPRAHNNLYMAIILGVNMLYINFRLLNEIPMASKGFKLKMIENHVEECS